MESRKHSDTISLEESAGLDEFVYELVRERLLDAVGAGGMWTLQFRTSTDTDSLFGETIAEFIARGIADQIAVSNAGIEVSNGIESETVLEDVDFSATPAPSVEVVVAAESVVRSAVPAPAEAGFVIEERHDEHRVFRPRQAA